jgi:predicted RND superfamily exporter protein
MWHVSPIAVDRHSIGDDYLQIVARCVYQTNRENRGVSAVSRLDTLVGTVTGRPKTVIAVLVVLIALVGTGAANIEKSPEMELFSEDPPEVTAQEYVQSEFTPHEGNTTELVVMVRNESGSVLDRASLLESLRYQQTLRQNETVNATLLDSGAMFGIENLVAAGAIQAERGDTTGPLTRDALPPLSAQVTQLESMTDAEVQAAVTDLLDPTSESALTEAALSLLPQDYEPGSPDADGRITIVTYRTDGLVVSVPELSEAVREGQVAADELAEATSRDEYRLSGYGLLLVEEQASISDSLRLVGPLALLFVVGTLALAYRDLIDVVLGLVGILLVLVWTFGVMGWLGINFNLMMIAVPILLIGLSIDYSIHVVMRYRENRAGNGVTEQRGASVAEAMHETLVGLGPALALVTVTAMLGFLSTRVSGVPTLTDFGVATAAGIVGALVVFGSLVPACKVVLEEWLVTRGHERRHRAVGTTGIMGAGLRRLARVSYRRPVAILAIVLLVSSLGAAGATQLDTSFSTDDYIAEDAPDWTQELPESLAPGDYELRETRDILYSSFQSPGQRVHIVSETAVTPATLERLAAAEQDAATRPVTVDGPTGEPAVTGPVGAMQTLAASNERFQSTLAASDTDDDGVPDRHLETVLDSFYEASPDRADQLLDRSEGGYEGAQVTVVVDGAEDPSVVAEQMRAVGDLTERNGSAVTVTGDAITNELVQRQLATTTVEGLAVTLVTVFAVLVVTFRYGRSLGSLGALTLAPVLFGLTWILGAMYVVDLPFSFATALIGSIAIGLGVDYAIHMSERFGHELDSDGDVERALEESVVGTGGALLGSAATTAGGFGVLAFAILPVMQQFGLLIALTLVAAFLASVLALPSLLVLWSRWAGYR